MYDTATYTYDAFARVPKFTGKERDSESGLDYFGSRYYAFSCGRFITPDWAVTRLISMPQTSSKRQRIIAIALRLDVFSPA